MTSYKLIIKQSGEGCDYMVGCGIKVISIDTSDPDNLGPLEAAKKLAWRELDVLGCFTAKDRELDYALLVLSADTLMLPIVSWKTNYEAEVRKQEERENEREERRELARLQRKYENV